MTRWYTPTPQSFELQVALGAPWLLFCMFNRVLPAYLSRKGIHMGIGVMLLHSDMSEWRMHAAVHTMTLSFLALSWAAARARVSLHAHLRFMHDKAFDPGVLSYLVTVSACAALGVAYVDMAVLFFADPMGALVGRNVATRKIYGAKSLGGTLAVFLTACVAWNDASVVKSVLGGAATAVVELYGGDYDNPLIAALLMVRALSG